MAFFTCISHPILSRVRCISADIQRPRADIGCDIKNAVIIFLSYTYLKYQRNSKKISYDE